MGANQASKRPIDRSIRKEKVRRARADKARDKEVTRRYGQPGHSQCGKKMVYATEEDASVVALKRAIETGMELRVYKCPFCGGWHMTHKKKRVDVDG